MLSSLALGISMRMKRYFFVTYIRKKTAGSLTKAQCGQLVEQIKQVLSNAIQQGGTTLKDFLQPDGRPGYFVQELRVYGNKDKPCPTCGTKIESLVIGQRNSFYCPKCQKR